MPGRTCVELSIGDSVAVAPPQIRKEPKTSSSHDQAEKYLAADAAVLGAELGAELNRSA